MLTHLSIVNFALLEELDLELGSGLTFLTGETGAGKSILIDAITRLLGARATQDDIRAGASKAILETIYDIRTLPLAAKKMLQEWEIDTDDENLIVRREIHSSGKSRTAINNCSVTLQQLRDLAPNLVDLFGQNEHQSLLDANSQQNLYDASIGIRSMVNDLAILAREIQSLQLEWKTLQQREQQRQREIDILQYQIHEIEQANVSEAEEQELTAKKILLQNSERIYTICESLLQELLEKDDSLVGMLRNVDKNVQELQKYKPELSDFATRLAEWQLGIRDLVESIDSLRRSLDFSEDSVDQLQNRLELMQRLKKKYGPTLQEVSQHHEKARQELDTLLHAEEREEDLVRQIRNAVQKYDQLAGEISRMRQASAETFQLKVENELKQVALERCRFRVRFVPSSHQNSEMMERTYAMHGWESVTFEIEPNTGEGFRELSRVASGGELSRLMLALKVVNQASGDASVLIFDEIDAGIGGRVAYQIGERLRQLSRTAQVLCVTHLPQVAAFGDHHYRVLKKEKAGRTITVVSELAETERVNELARMFSGSEVTETALQHARELREQVGARTL